MVVGAAAARWLVLPGAGSGPDGAGSPTPDPSRLVGACAAAGRAGALAALPALLLLFLAQLSRFRDPFAPWTEDAKLLVGGTDWGTVWLAGLGLAMVAAVAFHRAASAAVRSAAATLPDALAAGRIAWAVGTVAAAGLATTPALSGHAAAVEGPTRLALAADALHVTAAGVWLGGLAVVLWMERAVRKDMPDARSPLPELVGAFSPVALVAVPVLVITGSTGAWLHLPDWGSLLDSPYGRRLSLKIGVALLVFALGAVNWRRHRPALLADDPPGAGARGFAGSRDDAGESPPHRRLRRTAALELVLGQVVLALTAWLLQTSPSPP